MILFESMLLLLLLAIGLMQVSRRLAIPYPTMLCAAGVAVAALPWAPTIGIDPHLAMALFIAPALLDAAFDLPPRTLRQFWLPVVVLAFLAVLATTAAVAGVGVWLGGLPVAAAIALGAIVAPPDAAAASAMMRRFDLPRSTSTVITSESLLNDATALLIFTAAVGVAMRPETLPDIAPGLALAVPGGLALGVVLGIVFTQVARLLAGTLSGTLIQFVATFGTWIVAERLHLSAILAVVAYGMTVARYVPERTRPRDRLNAYAVWETAVFLLNVLAFLLMGLQARDIVLRLKDGAFTDAMIFAGTVLAVVIAVRLVGVMIYNTVIRSVRGDGTPTVAQGLVVSWCGMRGLVTLATALALPSDFPERDLIVLTAFSVVFGTLVFQGLTLGPLIRALNFKPDDSAERQIARARVELIDAAIASIKDRDDEDAQNQREIYQADRELAEHGKNPRIAREEHELRRTGIAAKRRRLAELRRAGEIDDDAFHELEQELDYAELANAKPDDVEIAET